MAGFNPDNYETVDSRIKRFYNDHDDGRIITHMLNGVSSEVAPKVVTFMAEIFCGDTLRATGFALEAYGVGGPVNKTSWLENCETSAIGRALANFNYSGDLRATREEMEKVKRMEKVKDPTEASEEAQKVALGAAAEATQMQDVQLPAKTVKKVFAPEPKNVDGPPPDDQADLNEAADAGFSSAEKPVQLPLKGPVSDPTPKGGEEIGIAQIASLVNQLKDQKERTPWMLRATKCKGSKELKVVFDELKSAVDRQ